MYFDVFVGTKWMGKVVADNEIHAIHKFASKSNLSWLIFHAKRTEAEQAALEREARKAEKVRG